MDGKRFDDLTRDLVTGTSSRRRIIKHLAAVALGAAVTRPRNSDAAICPPEQVIRSGMGCVCKTSLRPPGQDGCPCRTGEVRCEGACVSTDCKGKRVFDPATCACVCPTGTEECGGKCLLLCEVGKERDTATCECTCPAGTIDAFGGCVDFLSDEVNCGGCGIVCADDETCVDGDCQDANVCPPGLTTCGGACVDTQVNETQCGGCGIACQSGETCVFGQCRQVICVEQGQLCNPDQGFPCCAGGICVPTGGILRCTACQVTGQLCNPDQGVPCCDGGICVAQDGLLRCASCQQEGQLCVGDAFPCCPGLTCGPLNGILTCLIAP